MSDSNTSLDFSNLVNLLQDKVHSVEGRQKKNELFKDFLSDVLSETLQSPEIENIGKYSFEIREVNITEEFESIGKIKRSSSGIIITRLSRKLGFIKFSRA